MIDVAVIADADLPGDIRDALRTMLHDAFDSEFSDADWHHTCGGWRAVVFEDGMPVSHASVVERAITVDGRGLRAGYVEGVATAARRRGEGLGRAVLAAATDVVQARFEIGVLSTGVPRFYEVLGWVRWSGPSYVQDGDALVRTAEEDDGLMVLRFGPSAALDLSAAIACDCRAGDDW